ncbi:MAG: PorT family protein [Saprospiraceae bacterium]|nr:PorT family protein [Saprospiraceae bacterium]
MIILIALPVVFIRGQSSPIKIGVKAGMHVTNLDEGRYSDYDYFYPGAGIYAGITVDKSLSQKWDLNVEVLVVRRIAKEKYKDESGPILDYELSDHRIKSTSIMLPISMNYAIDRLNIQAGLFTEYYALRSTSGQAYHAEVATLSMDKDINAGVIIGGHYDFYNLEVGMRKLIGMINQEEFMINQDGIDEKISLYSTDDLQFYVKYLF